MTRKTLTILSIAVIAFIVAILAFILLAKDETPGDSQVTEFTPPPLSENPPMTGSAIDAIDAEMKERRNRRDPAQ